MPASQVFCEVNPQIITALIGDQEILMKLLVLFYEDKGRSVKNQLWMGLPAHQTTILFYEKYGVRYLTEGIELGLRKLGFMRLTEVVSTPDSPFPCHDLTQHGEGWARTILTLSKQHHPHFMRCTRASSSPSTRCIVPVFTPKGSVPMNSGTW